MARSGATTVLSWLGTHFIMRIQNETRHSNAQLSIYGMGDVSAFMIKVDAPLYTEWETCLLS
jgi:hypothetical protein